MTPCAPWDAGSLQIPDRGFDGLLVRQECCNLVDGSMSELINVYRGTFGHISSPSGRCFQDTLGRCRSHQNLGSTGYLWHERRSASLSSAGSVLGVQQLENGEASIVRSA